MAVRAFSIEVNQPPKREASLAQLRIEWWKETLEDAYSGKATSHPVSIAIASVLEEERATNKFLLSRGWFRRILDSRLEEIVQPKSRTDLESLEKHSEKCFSSIHYLVLEGADVRQHAAHHAASHLGSAEGLVDTLRGASSRRTALPSSILAERGASQEDVIRGRNRELVSLAARDVASVALSHLDRARSLASEVSPSVAKRALLPCVAVDAWLEAFEKVEFDLFHPRLRAGGGLAMAPIMLQARLWWNAWRETY